MKVLNNQKSPELLFDFGIKTTGYFFVELEGHSADQLQLDYGPVKDMVTSRKTINMPNPGNLFVDAEYIACRYLRVSLKSESSLPIDLFASIKSIGLKFSAYPAVYKGNFESRDERLNRIWEVGAYTAQICMQKNVYSSSYQTLPEKNTKFVENWRNQYSPYVMFDGPRRDREVWVGDLRTEGLIAYSAFGAYDVLKSSLILFHDLQGTDGIVPGCGSTWQSFREYNLWYIVSLWENYLFSGDKTFLEYMYPSFKSFMEWLKFNLNEDGLLFNEATWMWTFPREGYGSATQCILYLMLEDAAKIEEVMENEAEAGVLRTMAAKTKEAINRLYWDEDKGVYFDLIKIKDHEQAVLSDVNNYAVAFGIADQERSHRVLDYLKKYMWNPYGSTTIDHKIENPELTDDAHMGIAWVVRSKPNPKEVLKSLMWAHNKQIWPFMVAYEVEARLVAGDVDNALELIDLCWGNMLDKEPGTFWEMVNAEDGSFDIRPFQAYSKTDSMNSAAHGWSGWVSYLMQAYVLGVKPIGAGFKLTSIQPQLGKLTTLKGAVATPHGKIEVLINKNAVTYEILFKAPECIEVTVAVSDQELAGRKLEVKSL